MAAEASRVEEAPEEQAIVQAFHDGNFKTERPSDIEEEDCIDIEDSIRDLIAMAREGKAEEKEKIHARNLADFEEMPEDEAYYMALYREAFESLAQENTGCKIVE